MEVAVVGAGIHGSSTTLSLCKRGHKVTVFDRHLPGHNLGSSHGRSRIIRKAYADPFYTKIMLDGYPLWEDLQAVSDLPIVHHTGLLYFGNKTSEELASVQNSLAENSVEHHSLSASETENFVLNEEEFALLSTDGGWVHAENAVRASLFHSIELGASFVQSPISNWQELIGQFDRVVLAVGANILDFLSLDFSVRVQTVAYVKHNYEGHVWIEDGPDFLYGFPNAPEEDSVKIGVHLRGTPWDLRSPRPAADESTLELIKEFAHRRFGILSPEITEVVTCLYTMTPNEDFRWGKLADHAYYVSACSGHGFKFGPWIGERMADLVEGIIEPDSYPRFCFGTTGTI